MSFNWLEFTSIAIIHFFAVASPGPDFAVVLKNSLSNGRSIGIYTSLGVGAAIFLHVIYSLVGISFIIQTTPWLFSMLLYVAALYLIWMGIVALRSKPSNKNEAKSAVSNNEKLMSIGKAFRTGFITNGLNPKATLFFLSLFTVVISAQTDVNSKIIYGIYMAVATATWFIFVSFIASHKTVRAHYLRNGYWFDRMMGLVLISLAIGLVLTQ